MLRVRAWRGCGNGRSFHGRGGAGTGTAGLATLRYQFPYMERGAGVPIRHNRRKQRYAPRGRRAQPASRTSAHRRRKIVRRPDDIASPGESCATRRTWTGIPRLSASSGRSPSQDRAVHLFEVQIPMLFLQGTRDTLAALDELEPLCKKLGTRATLKLFADADHSFYVCPRGQARESAQVLGDVLDALAAWLDSVIAPLGRNSSGTGQKR